jgi:hypothetical protein
MFSGKRWRVRDKFTVFQGIVTGNNTAFLPTTEQVRGASIEKDLLRSVVLGRDFEKWCIRSTERRIIYVNADTDMKRCPNVEKWLVQFRAVLKKRRECVNGVIPWYSLQWPRAQTELDRVPKILVQGTRNPRLATRVVAAMDEHDHIYGTQGVNFIVPLADDAPIYFLLAVLNSMLVNYLFATKYLNVAIKAEYLKDLPIPDAASDEVEKLSRLARDILAAKSSDPKADVREMEEQIDEQVYKLYGINDIKDIAIIQAAPSSVKKVMKDGAVANATADKPAPKRRGRSSKPDAGVDV